MVGRPAKKSHGVPGVDSAARLYRATVPGFLGLLLRPKIDAIGRTQRRCPLTATTVVCVPPTRRHPGQGVCSCCWSYASTRGRWCSARGAAGAGAGRGGSAYPAHLVSGNAGIAAGLSLPAVLLGVSRSKGGNAEGEEEDRPTHGFAPYPRKIRAPGADACGRETRGRPIRQLLPHYRPSAQTQRFPT